jgi:cation transport ATPase-like protein
VLGNKPLVAGIAVTLAFAAALVYLPALHGFFGTAALSPGQLATVAPFPFIVWGADEIRRAVLRHRNRARSAPAAADGRALQTLDGRAFRAAIVASS